MGVAKRHLVGLVSQPVRYGKRAEAHLYEKRYVAVTEVVNPNRLETARGASSLHLVVQVVFGKAEDAAGAPLLGD